MARDAADTKERILAAAQGLVMKHGFSATSIDQIQEAAEISRGTFFYHFPSKDDLARELLVRYAEIDREIVDRFMARAERLARDPLEQVLVFLGLHEEMFEELDAGEHPGCLFASYSYEAGLFDAETHDVIERSIEHWRELVGGKLEEAFRRHPPATPTDPYVLADVAYAILQGAFILSRVRGEPGILAEHTRQFRASLEVLCGTLADADEAQGAAAAP